MIGCQVSLYLGWVYRQEDDLISLRRKPESRFQSHAFWKIQSLVNSANCHFCQSADGNIYQDIGTYLYKTSLVHHVQLILSPPHCLLFVHLSPGFCVIMVNSSNVIWRFVVCIWYLLVLQQWQVWRRDCSHERKPSRCQQETRLQPEEWDMGLMGYTSLKKWGTSNMELQWYGVPVIWGTSNMGYQ